jgi:hypothetical protein
VHLAQQWINQEIFRNKHPANYNHSIFIHVFQFDSVRTSYIAIRGGHSHIFFMSSFATPQRSISLTAFLQLVAEMVPSDCIPTYPQSYIFLAVRNMKFLTV